VCCRVLQCFTVCCSQGVKKSDVFLEMAHSVTTRFRLVRIFSHPAHHIPHTVHIFRTYVLTPSATAISIVRTYILIPYTPHPTNSTCISYVCSDTLGHSNIHGPYLYSHTLHTISRVPARGRLVGISLVSGLGSSHQYSGACVCVREREYVCVRKKECEGERTRVRE